MDEHTNENWQSVMPSVMAKKKTEGEPSEDIERVVGLLLEADEDEANAQLLKVETIPFIERICQEDRSTVRGILDGLVDNKVIAGTHRRWIIEMIEIQEDLDSESVEA